MPRLILLRHGESVWNRENRFTGWKDVDLSENGLLEARRAGQAMRNAGFLPDIVFTSYLKRAIRTMWLALDEMDALWLPVVRSWRLNERHYGALEGLNKAETASKYGEAQVKIWRRSFDTLPPAIDQNDPRYPGRDRRYAELTAQQIPLTESLKTVIDRVMPFWEGEIAPQLSRSRNVLVVAHGNTLRAILMRLNNISREAIVELNVPTGVPLLMELNQALQPLTQSFLGDPETVARAQAAVAAQGEAK